MNAPTIPEGKPVRKTWLKSVVYWLVLFLGTGLVALLVAAYVLTDNIRSLTAHLPHTDRIEIESVHLNGEEIDGVLATKILTGSENQELENLWRSQNYTYGAEVMCHEPGYRIRFYKNDALLTEATICFHCHNIYFYKYPGAKSPDDYEEAVFGKLNDDTADIPYTKLRTYLSSLFPGHDPGADKP